MTAQVHTTSHDTAANTLGCAGAAIWSGVRAVFTAFGNASIGARCAEEARRLNGLSDAELAKLGLTRDGIIQHAFRRFMAL